MSQINPFISSAIQASDVQRLQATDKDRQLRRATELRKDSALGDDRFEHAVESAEEVAPIHDEQEHDAPNRRQPLPKHKKNPPEEPEDESHLDLKA